MFEKASRKKIRFQYNGKLTTEELWDLSLQDLNKIFQKLDEELSAVPRKSLLDDDKVNSKVRNDLQLKIDVVTHIVKYKQKQIQTNLAKQQAQTQRTRILEEQARRQAGEVTTLSEDDLAAQLAQFDAVLAQED